MVLILVERSVWNLLEKKDVVQKSFRINKQDDIWLGYLAVKLGRSQNELVNIAIKMLLEDNKKWLFEYHLQSMYHNSIGPEHDDCNVKKRLGDTEVELIPYNVNPKANETLLKITYYKDDRSDEVTAEDTKSVYFGPGHDQRVIDALTEVFIPSLDKYPQIFKPIQYEEIDV